MKQISIEKYYKPGIIEELRVTKAQALNGHTFKFINSDLALLFNQERLEKLGQDSVIDYLNSLVPSSDGLAELKKNCTDEELISLVKSRHIQSRNELQMWSEWLNYNKGELDRAIAQAKASSSASVDTVESKSAE